MSQTTSVVNVLNLISSLGAFVLALGGVVVALFLRFGRKLKLKDCRITPCEDGSGVMAIEFTVKNKSMKHIIVNQIGLGIKNPEERYKLCGFPEEILPKGEKIVPSGTFSTGDPRRREHAEKLKKEIAYLYIKHNAGPEYRFRKYDFLTKAKRESGLLE